MKPFRIIFCALAIVASGMTIATAAERRAVLAGGCFWGVEAVFEHVKGVKDVRAGYAGGSADTARYDLVSAGDTEHAEAVEIIFDDSTVTYEQLLYIFFAVVHDPTEVDRQGPDIGPQYRSAVFYLDEKQKMSAEAFIRSIDLSKAFDRPVATKITHFVEFFPAENYHQNYLKRNPTDAYIVQHDLPKLAHLKKKFPEFWVDRYRLRLR